MKLVNFFMIQPPIIKQQNIQKGKKSNVIKVLNVTIMIASAAEQ